MGCVSICCEDDCRCFDGTTVGCGGPMEGSGFVFGEGCDGGGGLEVQAEMEAVFDDTDAKVVAVNAPGVIFDCADRVGAEEFFSRFVLFDYAVAFDAAVDVVVHEADGFLGAGELVDVVYNIYSAGSIGVTGDVKALGEGVNRLHV